MEENKPIMIDGVDVSGCQYLYFTIEDNIIDCKEHPRCSIGEAFTNNACKNSNCYYKQLARKTQSEERLIKQIQTICDFINNRPETFKGVYGSVDKIITDYAERKEQECEELEKKLKYIRDENIHLKKSATDEQIDFLALNNYIKTLEFQLDQLKTEKGNIL